MITDFAKKILPVLIRKGNYGSSLICFFMGTLKSRTCDLIYIIGVVA